MIIQNCFFMNKKHDLVVEFITRKEGVHKIYLYIRNELVDDTPFFIYVNGDLFTTTAAYWVAATAAAAAAAAATSGGIGSSSARSSTSNTLGVTAAASWPHLRQSQLQLGSPPMSRAAIASSEDFSDVSAMAAMAVTAGGTVATTSARSFESDAVFGGGGGGVGVGGARQQFHQSLGGVSSSSSVSSGGGGGANGSSICLAGLGNSTILCARKDYPFHFVITDKNIQGLCVYGKF